MDTLINLTIAGFSVSFDNKKKVETDEWYQDFEIYPEDERSAFKFSETDNIKGTFKFGNNLKVFIELPTTGEYQEIISGETIRINDTYSDDCCFTAGSYDLVIEHGSQRYTRHFFVDSKQLGYKNVNNLRDYVNSFYNGLSYDLTKVRKTWISYEGEPGYGQNFFTNYNFIHVNYPKIMNYINRQINDKHDELVKKEVITNKASSISSKSINWLVRKGFAKNKDISHPEYVLTKKTFFALGNEENRIFKAHVEFWANQLKDISDSLNIFITGYNNIICKEKQKMLSYEIKASEYETNSYISEKEKKDLKGKIIDSKKIVERDSNLIGLYNKQLIEIDKYRKFTTYILNGTWLKNISSEPNYSSKLVKDKTLIILNGFRDRYLGQKNKNNGTGAERVEYFAQKNTPKLFETYIYIMLINIIRSLGFEMLNGYSKQDMIALLSNESNLVFQNDEGKTIEVHYDEYLDLFSCYNVAEGFCSINSVHNKPDFVIAIKDENGSLTNSVVIEAKWRQFKSIYNEKGRTEVMTNLADYLSLGYTKMENGRAKLLRNPVSKVFVLYPDYEEKQNELLNDYIYSQSLSIGENIENSESYSNLKKLIKEVI